MIPNNIMQNCDTLIRNASILDGTGATPQVLDVALRGDRIHAIGPSLDYDAAVTIDAQGLSLSPGFIDVHTHDDTSVVNAPEMLPKLSQGVTTVIVGNCGISASPVHLHGDPPDPMNLLGDASAFLYPTFAAYVAAVNQARPSVNVGALIGHTSLRNNHMDRLDRVPPQTTEIAAMRAQLQEALDGGALGLSSGLAYLSANSATTEEVLQLAEPLSRAGGVYTTHMRTETEAILDAMYESFTIAEANQIPVIISHLKCAGIANWGRSPEVLHSLWKQPARPSRQAATATPTPPAPAPSICARSTSASPSPSPGARPIPRWLARPSPRSPPPGTSPSSKPHAACNPPEPSTTASPKTTCAASSRTPPP